jgi:hypothetical protein
LAGFIGGALSLGACEAKGLAAAPPGGNIPAAIAAADGGGSTTGLFLPAATAGDLLRSRLFFRGILIFTRKCIKAGVIHITNTLAVLSLNVYSILIVY